MDPDFLICTVRLRTLVLIYCNIIKSKILVLICSNIVLIILFQVDQLYQNLKLQACACNWFSYCDVFSVVFPQNCGFFASQFSPHCGINFLQCSEDPFSVLPELIPLHHLESRGLSLCVFSPYIKETQSILLACKLGFTKYNESQNF